ncbi:hypothetical protein ACFW1M_25010 [Streptomyces inhibens]|uniref:hypothetical protein n=1 Tax=Streptomyces inhibens TaxID=2293571 RepID=UPI0036B8B030
MSVEGTWNIVIATPVGQQQAVLRLFSEDGALRVAAGTAKAGRLPATKVTGRRDTAA